MQQDIIASLAHKFQWQIREEINCERCVFVRVCVATDKAVLKLSGCGVIALVIVMTVVVVIIIVIKCHRNSLSKFVFVVAYLARCRCWIGRKYQQSPQCDSEHELKQ